MACLASKHRQPNHKPTKPVPRTTTQAQQAQQAAIVRILKGRRQLRQFQIAAELGLTEHHDWTTHAILNAMVRDGILWETYYHEINKDGSYSKKTYRHFSLAARTRAEHPYRPMRKRDILRDWARALGF